MVTGKDLIAMGLRPGNWFKPALEFINSNNLVGEALISYIDSIKPPPMIPLYSDAVKYYVNIKSDSELEQENINQVIQTMDALMKTPTIVGGAIMPDACPAGPLGTIPVGGVVAAKKAIHPGMHSADICCSVMLTNLGKADPREVMDLAHATTHFGPVFRTESNTFILSEELLEEFLANPLLKTDKCISLAKDHLGTQGDGNHFLYVGFSKETNDTILVTHHGSRGVGGYLYKTGMAIAENFRKNISEKTLPGNAWIPSDSKEGEQYWSALQTIRKWTKMNHEVIHQRICDLLQIAPLDRYWNEHNFVFKEGDIFYHAKGATPLSEVFMPEKHTQKIIPLNMCQPILIVEGVRTENNLGFAPHGAGRNISRSKHKKNKNNRTIEDIFQEETMGYDIRFYSNHIDISELPSAYKNAEQVKAQIKDFDLATIVDEIMPYGSMMAGDWEKNMPWRNKKK